MQHEPELRAIELGLAMVIRSIALAMPAICIRVKFDSRSSLQPWGQFLPQANICQRPLTSRSAAAA